MPVSPAPVPNVLPASAGPLQLGADGISSRHASRLPAQIAGRDPRAVAAEAAAPETVALSAAAPLGNVGAGARAALEGPVAVYAEIWRDGVKVAEIDSHGGVSALAGLPPPPVGGVSGGAWLAAARAVQVAQAVGGEIRVAGQTVDAATLRMRARLQAAYGV